MVTTDPFAHIRARLVQRSLYTPIQIQRTTHRAGDLILTTSNEAARKVAAGDVAC